MKKIMAIIAATALILTGCGQIDEEVRNIQSGAEVQTGDFSSKAVTEIKITETGGEDGRDNECLISQIADHYVVIQTDNRFGKTFTYNISDEDYHVLTDIDFYHYIDKTEDNDGINDAVYYTVSIIYDDGTEDEAEVYIPDLWNKLYEIIAVYEPIDTELSEIADSNDDEPFDAEFDYIDISDNEPIEDIGEAYYKEVGEDDVMFDEEHGVKYARNQLIISVFPETDKIEVEKIVSEIDADIVGFIKLTGDYQIEFHNNKTLDELDNIADYINSYSFVMNVTLNIISDVTNAETMDW